MAKIRNKVDCEIIVNVEKIVDAETTKATFTAVGLDGTDYTAEINQKKLKYAFENKGVVRGRTNAAGERVWRVVKQKFIKDEPVEDNPELPATE